MIISNLFKNGFVKRARGVSLEAALCFVLVGVSQPGIAQMDIDFDAVEIRTLPVQGNIYVLFGAGGNITVQVGDEGVLVVDTMFAPLSDKVLAAIRELSDRPLQFVINTHAHPDHVGGNAKLAEAGVTITSGNVGLSLTVDDIMSQAAIIAHENVLKSMIVQDPQPPFEMWPTSTYYTGSKDLYFNGESIRFLHMPNAHTNGDTIVYFRRSDVISTGDIFNMVSFPYIDVAGGGSIQGIIDALNSIIDLTVPLRNQEGGTMVIPGHGRVADEFEVVEYRDMLTIIRDRIQALIDDGMSLRQVQRMDPTKGWNNRFGSDSWFWTTEQFVEAIYRELIEGS